MMSRLVPLLPLMACAPAPEGALLAPADVDVLWDTAWNDVSDGVAAYVPVDVMAYDSATGDALVGVAVGLLVNGVAVDALWPHEVATSDDDCRAEDETGCGDAWDAWADRWVIDPEVGSVSTEGLSDHDGLVRWTVRVDAFPTEGGELLPQPVTVYGMDIDETFLIVPR